LSGYAGWVTGDNIVTRPDPGYHPNPGPGINPANPYRTLGLVTDAAGDAHKACHLFARKHPSVIVIDCYVHQVVLHKLNATPVLILIA